jgi:hypothetical protein
MLDWYVIRVEHLICSDYRCYFRKILIGINDTSERKYLGVTRVWQKNV